MVQHRDCDIVIEDYYKAALCDEHKSVALATLKTLIKVLENNDSTTVAELRDNVRGAIDKLKHIESCVQVESVSEIFLRFITLYVSRYDLFTSLKSALLKRSKIFLRDGVIGAKEKAARLAMTFCGQDTRILVHSKSMTVLETLKKASAVNINIFAYVTESRPDSSGKLMCELLTKAGIGNKLIVDASIGIYLEKVDLVMVGAEGVCESGGVLNKIGTYPLAICAAAMNKPFYVVAESYKFIRMFPLKQSDLPSSNDGDKLDYTPPAYITLILTDLGPLTTAAISDELMKIYE